MALDLFVCVCVYILFTQQYKEFYSSLFRIVRYLIK